MPDVPCCRYGTCTCQACTLSNFVLRAWLPWTQVSELRAELQRADARVQQERAQQGANGAVQQQDQQQPQREQQHKQQQLQQALGAGGDAPSSAGGDGPQRLPELLDYITPAPGSEFETRLWDLAHKVFGRVLFRDPLSDAEAMLQVWAVSKLD